MPRPPGLGQYLLLANLHGEGEEAVPPVAGGSAGAEGGGGMGETAAMDVNKAEGEEGLCLGFRMHLSSDGNLMYKVDGTPRW